MCTWPIYHCRGAHKAFVALHDNSMVRPTIHVLFCRRQLALHHHFNHIFAFPVGDVQDMPWLIVKGTSFRNRGLHGKGVFGI